MKKDKVPLATRKNPIVFRKHAPAPQKLPDEDRITDDDLRALRLLQSNEGWLVLRKIMELNIEYLKRQILEDDELSEPISITQRDLVRKWLRLNQELIELPEKLTASAESNPGAKAIEMDPYFRTVSQLRDKMPHHE